MMNQNSRVSGTRRGGCFGGDSTPYRHAYGRGDLPSPAGGARVGGHPASPCGCGNRNHPEHGGSLRPPSGRNSSIPATNGGCGCQSSGCERLMSRIRAVDFALYETVLYLDVYPHSCDALETYHKLRAQSEALHAEYEASCGPLTAFGNRGDTWDWMSGPFPWEYGAE